jgi:hypothetical protein
LYLKSPFVRVLYSPPEVFRSDTEWRACSCIDCHAVSLLLLQYRTRQQRHYYSGSLWEPARGTALTQSLSGDHEITARYITASASIVSVE